MKKTKLKYWFLVIFMALNLSFFGKIFCQNVEKPDSTTIDNTEPYRYNVFSFGLSQNIIRDLATSPLYYQGPGMFFYGAWLKTSSLKESYFEFGFNGGLLNGQIPSSNYITQSTNSSIVQFNMAYSLLWKLKSISNQKNNFKIGGIIYTTQEMRLNPSLENNSFGFENLSNIMFSGQFKRDISRHIEKHKKFLFIKYTLKPEQRDFRIRANIGVLNFNYRPGYSYLYEGGVDGAEASPFSGFSLSLNGWRLKTEVEMIRYLPLGRANGLAYVWEATSAPGKFEGFQMATHQLRFTQYLRHIKR